MYDTNLSMISNAREVLDERAKENRIKKLDEDLKYYKSIVKNQAEKNACDAILNSNYSTEDKEYLFNNGLFRTEKELQKFEAEKKREEFINSGKWKDYCESKNTIVNVFYVLTAIDFFIGIIALLSGAFDVVVFCGIIFLPLGFVTLIVNLVISSEIENKGKEFGINDKYTKKAKIERVSSTAGLIATGASVARNTKKFAKQNGFI